MSFHRFQGWDEMRTLARRLKAEFPELLNSSYDENNFSFTYTDTQRAQASFQAFAEGLFGEKAYNYVKSVRLPENDTIFSPYFNCDKWSLRGPIPQVVMFEESEIFRNVISNVSARFRFKRLLDVTELETIYDICRYDVAWKVNDPSPWCAVSASVI